MKNVEQKQKTVRDPWLEVLRLVDRHVPERPGKGTPCPRVGAVITQQDDGGCHRILVREYHNHQRKGLDCSHAEADAICVLLRRLKRETSDLQQCQLYTSLEPCSHRSHFRVPCAHRIATLGFGRVHIGMLDPDPDIYARSAGYLIKNLGAGHVDYAPKSVRKRILKRNKRFIDSKQERYGFRAFKEKLPIFTGIDEELYLGLAHGLSRMYDGEKLVWFFPELPSFSDKHKFHAWWAQGVLENPYLKNVELIIHEDPWMRGIAEAKRKHMANTLCQEFRGHRRPVVKLLVIPNHKEKGTNRCPCHEFCGAMFFNKQGKLDCLVAVSYSNAVGLPLTMFLACEPKYFVLAKLQRRLLGETGREPKQKELDRLLEKLQQAYEKAKAMCNKPENMYHALAKQLKGTV